MGKDTQYNGANRGHGQGTTTEQMLVEDDHGEHDTGQSPRPEPALKRVRRKLASNGSD